MNVRSDKVDMKQIDAWLLRRSTHHDINHQVALNCTIDRCTSQWLLYGQTLSLFIVNRDILMDELGVSSIPTSKNEDALSNYKRIE